MSKGQPLVCLITTGQPSTNPRLVKEADALSAAGYRVEVVCTYWTSWALETDETVRATRTWSVRYVGGSPRHERVRYAWTRLRCRLGRAGVEVLPAAPVFARWAVCRMLPELERAAGRVPADLYIAHNLGALPAAVHAADTNRARVGFDAEDFHSGTEPCGSNRSPAGELVERIERTLLPHCDYVTAASAGIAQAYAEKYEIPKPVTILNVFPLSQRPERPGESRPADPLRLYWFSQTIGPDRGLEDVLVALALLRDLPLELHLRGIWQPGYRERIRELLECAGEGRIVTHPPASPDEMVRLASRFDVGLALEHPVSENRNICLTNKIFTYLLAGNAVIGTSTRGQRPILEQIGAAAFIYPPGDVKALAERLRTWCHDRKALQAARSSAWHWGTVCFNWDVQAPLFLRVVTEALQGRTARSRTGEM